ncbi:MAG: hypothetical protein KF901_26460 [Myxococcales bacterium]|nr:hypothetical protein [Myxococcales bacterium]
MKKRWLGLGLVLALGCGDDDRPSSEVDAGAPPTGTDAGPTPVADGGPVTGEDAGSPGFDAGPPPADRTTVAPEAARERMVGTWALEARFATIQTVPFLGDQRSVSRAWGLVDISPEGETLVLTERGCRVQIEGGGSTTTTIRDAVPRSVEPRPVTLEFADGGATWIRPEIANAIGFHASGPTDALPMDASDPRVYDQDGDGHPGVTVSISGLASGDLYVVQWQRGWYRGQVGTSGPILGENLADGGSQRPIGGTNSILQMDIPSRSDENRSDNTLRLIPLTGEYDCDRLVAEAESVFGS